MVRTITLEEHYASPAFMEGPGRELKALTEAVRDHPRVAAGYAKLIERLRDLDDGRIAAMDAEGIDVQVLSLTFPGVEQLDAAEARASQTKSASPTATRSASCGCDREDGPRRCVVEPELGDGHRIDRHLALRPGFHLVGIRPLDRW
jgi:hypothetical protein